MVIRKAEIEDIDNIMPLVATFRDTLRGFKKLPPQGDLLAAKEELMYYCQSGSPIYIAEEDDGNYIGYMVCRVDAPTVWVESFYVLPEHRKKGTASTLYEQAERLAKSYGEDTVYNYVHPNNDAMIGFLKKKGYNVLNLIEIRKKYADEVIQNQMQVGHHRFDY